MCIWVKSRVWHKVSGILLIRLRLQSQNRNELSKAPMPVQQSEDNVILSTLGIDNLELGTEVLTRVVREVLEKVFEAKLGKHGELV
ncbi:hypothetical protein J1N35_004865 [Gossypium stocksii]|uniref:Uncharacterized protein n=1 Tax=Gossypium stocksii TaxID=47602 RepID=A0A9D3WE91_9ROSI|nr:hypothetical protein J1N35_004865 [Gossypium stocksii]